MLSLEKTAKVLGVTLCTLRRWIDKGIVPQPKEVGWGKKYPEGLVKVMNDLLIELKIKGKKQPLRYMIALDFSERLKQRIKYGKEGGKE